ncbi:MAG: NAD(P)/FAD-dependent oxidoreductase [Gammaproteobacteria bacterium]|nr:NAD(P)/FAD-dependent oxidoreductase [Gammaproteobacteria bacterium]
MARKPKIVIVGGGTSGLAAAYTLRSKYGSKLEVVVLEAADRAGGRIAGEEIGGFSIHTGASVFHESFETVQDLAENLGVPLTKSPRKKGGHLYRGGKLWGIYVGGSPRQMLTTVRTFLSFRLFTLKGLWQSMRFFGMLKARGNDIDFQDHSRMLDLDTPESFAEFMKANSLVEYLEQTGEVDINCFTAGCSEEVGAALGMAMLWLWTLNQSERSCLPGKGVGEFADALVGACAEDTRLGTPVQRVVVEEGCVKGVMAGNVGNGDGFVEADAVICAAPATKALEIIPDLPPEARRILSRVTYSSCINMAIGLDANILPEGSHAAVFPPESGTFLTNVSNLASMAPQAAPEGKSLVYALVIGEHARELFALSDDEIAGRIIEEISKYLPTMPEKPLFARVYRWPEALCLAPGGMLKEIYEMRQQKLVDLEGLFLAGDYMRMPSCNGALLSGVDAAGECASFVSRDTV